MKAGDNQSATAILVNALDHIDLKDQGLWMLARKDLYSIIQVDISDSKQ